MPTPPTPPTHWRCRSRSLPLTDRTLVMGIVNVTPDSFSDGGLFLDPSRALEHALALVAEGADILDLGAESTRPGSQSVTPGEQIARLRPVLERLRPRTEVAISIDTASAEVAREMLALGADIINDITALRADPDMAATIASSGAGCVLMHMLGTPATMQQDPRYADVVTEVRDFLQGRIDVAIRGGIAREAIAIDPGIGFGKTIEHNLRLIAHTEALCELGHPVLMGVSRKAFIGRILNIETAAERLEGTLAAIAVSVMKGAQIVRVHDVQATRRVVDMIRAIQGQEG